MEKKKKTFKKRKRQIAPRIQECYYPRLAPFPQQGLLLSPPASLRDTLLVSDSGLPIPKPSSALDRRIKDYFFQRMNALGPVPLVLFLLLSVVEMLSLATRETQCGMPILAEQKRY